MCLRVRLLRAGARIPLRATPHSTGLDLFACLETPVRLGPHPQLVPTGIAIECPAGYDAQVRPRSGLSARGIGVAFGTIDADYRGEVLVTMWTFGETVEYEISDGDRIAQLVVATVALPEVEVVDALSDTQRGGGGHGSTGR